MAEEFVMKDVFDANIQRIEAIVDRNLAKHEAIASEMRGEFKAINAQMRSMEDKLSLNVTVTGVIVAAFGIIITIIIAAIQLWR